MKKKLKNLLTLYQTVNKTIIDIKNTMKIIHPAKILQIKNRNLNKVKNKIINLFLIVFRIQRN